MHRALWWSLVEGRFLLCEVPLYSNFSTPPPRPSRKALVIETGLIAAPCFTLAFYLRANTEQLKPFQGPLAEGRGDNLALTVLYVPHGFNPSTYGFDP